MQHLNAFSKFESRHREPSTLEPSDEPWTGWRVLAVWTAAVLASWLIVWGVGIAIYEIVLAVAP